MLSYTVPFVCSEMRITYLFVFSAIIIPIVYVNQGVKLEIFLFSCVITMIIRKPLLCVRNDLENEKLRNDNLLSICSQYFDVHPLMYNAVPYHLFAVHSYKYLALLIMLRDDR